MKLNISFLIVLVILANTALAQLTNPVQWSFDQKEIEENKYELYFDATIDDGWHLYSNKLPVGGPIATSVKFNNEAGIEVIKDFSPTRSATKVFDKTFNMDLEYFGDEVKFMMVVEVDSGQRSDLSGYVEYMSCDDETCTPPAETDFIFTFTAEKQAAVAAQISDVASSDMESADSGGSQSLWLFLLVAFLAGLAAIITPCVFPMIPMTVSFFMRGSGDRKKGIKNALAFGGSIVLIYTLLGALFSIGVFGPNIGSILSTHWIPNTIFFVLFFVFALSFFGLFEIVLPSSLVNKTDSKVDQGGLIGAFFMALTTVIVSFSCTGPFIGYLIVEAVQGGGMRPLLGMFAFGLAFATPFTLLAVFPSALKKLPKSGGWLNSVKVVFAFILLAFGMKFLSNIDQVYGFNILTREFYLIVWIVLFSLLGIYLLGKIRFSHDSELKHLSVGRFLLSAVSFIFALYLFTGLLGAPLKPVSALLPPQSTKPMMQTSLVSQSQRIQTAPECGPAKYADKLHLPYNLNGYFDYEQGLACAKEQDKPVFLVFKGHACANCKKMENTVWDQPDVLEMLAKDYVVIALYTDDRTSLPEREWKTSLIDGKTLKTMGRVNLDLLMSKYEKNSIPYHVIIEPDGSEHEMGVTYENDEFVRYLEKGL
ncbi:MAG: protein-disulfide reductase DsbD family protein [Prolixibacteraceae bacterium]|jgi:thiol:disulfide interchange protein|nr:protein-disulfide reductase DsbD family protein [Prolixibacteraceae bacterium]